LMNFCFSIGISSWGKERVCMLTKVVPQNTSI
jgi:hypothetical protein